MIVRNISCCDEASVAEIILPVIQQGETYALPRTWSADEALAYWLLPVHEVFVAEDGDGAVIGTYYMQANQLGGGSHVANCGYVTSSFARSRGAARAMCLHSLDHAAKRGFRAMQFNFVVSSNERAVRLWQSLGFAIVGTLPQAFRHPSLGYVDAYTMHRFL